MESKNTRIKIWNIYACFQHNKCRTSQNIKHILFFGQKYIKIRIQISAVVSSLLRSSLSFKFGMSYRLAFFPSFALASVKMLIWSKSKRLPNIHTYAHAHTHLHEKITNKTKKKIEQKMVGRAFCLKCKIMICFLLLLLPPPLLLLLLFCCCYFQWTILFTINLVSLDSYLYYAIQFAWLFSDLLKMHWALVQHNLSPVCSLAFSLSLALHFFIHINIFIVHFLLFYHKYHFDDG